MKFVITSCPSSSLDRKGIVEGTGQFGDFYTGRGHIVRTHRFSRSVSLVRFLREILVAMSPRLHRRFIELIERTVYDCTGSGLDAARLSS